MQNVYSRLPQVQWMVDGTVTCTTTVGAAGVNRPAQDWGRPAIDTWRQKTVSMGVEGDPWQEVRAGRAAMVVRVLTMAVAGHPRVQPWGCLPAPSGEVDTRRQRMAEAGYCTLLCE